MPCRSGSGTPFQSSARPARYVTVGRVLRSGRDEADPAVAGAVDVGLEHDPGERRAGGGDAGDGDDRRRAEPLPCRYRQQRIGDVAHDQPLAGERLGERGGRADEAGEQRVLAGIVEPEERLDLVECDRDDPRGQQIAGHHRASTRMTIARSSRRPSDSVMRLTTR